MGRKSQSKPNPKKNAGKENNKFVLQKRKELALLVDKLLRLTSIFQSGTNLNKTWEHHLEVEKIVMEIRNIERSQNKSSNLPRQACIDKFMKWLSDNEVQFEGKYLHNFHFSLKSVY